MNATKAPNFGDIQIGSSAEYDNAPPQPRFPRRFAGLRRFAMSFWRKAPISAPTRSISQSA